MIATHDFLLRARIDATTLEAWLEAGWLRAPAQGGAERFADVDLARARLIRDLQQDIGVNAELPRAANRNQRAHVWPRRRAQEHGGLGIAEQHQGRMFHRDVVLARAR